ncbi:MAG: diguanylate cyclase [Anaerovoracaceae bacterium]
MVKDNIRRNRKIGYICIIIILALVTVFSAAYYKQGAEENAKNEAYEQLTDITREQAVTLNTSLEGEFSLLETFSNFLVINNDFNKEHIRASMTAIVNKSVFRHMAFLRPDGVGYLNDGRKIIVANRAYFKSVMNGVKSFEKVEKTQVDNTTRFILAVPVKKGKEVVGALLGSYNEDTLRSIIKTRAFDGKSSTFICDRNGEVVIDSGINDDLFGKGTLFESYNNLIDAYKASDSASPEVSTRLKKELAKGYYGILDVSYRGNTSNIIYVPLGVNDWMLVNGIPSEVVYSSIKNTSDKAMTMVIIIFACIMLILIVIFIQARRNEKYVNEEQEKLRISEEEYRIASQQSGKTIARFDIETETMYQHRFDEKLNTTLITIENVVQMQIEKGVISTDTKNAYLEFFDKIKRGEPKGSVDMRMRRKGTEDFCWYHADYTIIYDKKEKPKYAIISMEDITAQREHELAYELWKQNITKLPLEKTAIFEYNMTLDELESARGKLLIASEVDNSLGFNQRTMHWANTIIYKDDIENYLEFLNLERLLKEYYAGKTEDSLSFRSYAEDKLEYKWIRLTVRMVEYPGTNNVKGVLIYENIHEEKMAELAIKEKSEIDSLTGLLNRSTLENSINNLIELNPNAHHVIIMLDIDNFKQINDTLGHIAGDNALLEVSRRLKSILRKGDIIGRIGGDEFMICLKNISFKEAIKRRMEFISQLMNFEVAKQMGISGSLGVALYPKDGKTFDELYHNADIAVYKAKENGRNCYVFYDSSMEELASKTSPTPIDNSRADNQLKFLKDSRLEKALKHNNELWIETNDEEKYRKIMEKMGIISVELNAITGEFLASENFYNYKISDQEPEILFSRNVDLSGIHPDDKKLFENQMFNIGNQEENKRRMAVRLCLKDGGYDWCRVNIIIIRDSNDNVRKYLAVINKEDIAKNHSQLLVDAITNYMSAGIIMFEVSDIGLNTIYVSPIYSNLEGEHKLSIVGGDALDNIHPDDRDWLEKKVRETVKTGDVADYVCRVNPIMGDRWLKGSIIRIPYEENNNPVMMAIETDITDIVNQKQELIQSNEMLFTVNSVIGIFKIKIDEEFTVIYGNKKFYEIHGYKDIDDMRKSTGLKAMNYLHKDSISMVKDILESENVDGELLDLEVKVYTKDNSEKWTYVWGSFVTDANGVRFLNGCVVDVSEKRTKMIVDAKAKVAEEHIKETAKVVRAKLQYIYQMSALETFEVDIKARRLTFAGGVFANYSKEEATVDNIPDSLIADGTIHSGSAKEFRKLCKNIFSGVPEGNVIVKAKIRSDEYVLTRISYRCIYDSNNNPVEAVAISETLENIADARLRFEQEEKLHLLVKNDLVFYGKINLTQNEFEYSICPDKGKYPFKESESYSEAFFSTAKCIKNEEDKINYSNTFGRESLIEALLKGEEWIYHEYRMSMDDGKIVWYAHSVQLLTSPYNNHVYAFLYVRNTNERKKLELALDSKAEFDVTGTFYTRATLKAVAEKKLEINKEKSGLWAIASIKIVNINEIIERFGAFIIDRLMISINRKLRYSISNVNITARTDENEIVVFFGDIKSKEWFTELGDYILHILHNPTFFTTAGEQYAVYQMGAAVFGHNENITFEKAYRKAFLATTAASVFKPNILYNESEEMLLRESIKLVPAGVDVKTPQKNEIELEVILKASSILSMQKDITKTMNEVLSIVGDFYGAERAYILEVDKDNRSLDNTFEWCGKGVSPQIDNLKGVLLTDVPTFEKAYETNQAILINDLDAMSATNPEYIILADQGIHALYVVPYASDNEVVGFLGIDNPTKNMEHISTIHALAYFLLSELFKRKGMEFNRYRIKFDMLSNALSRNSLIDYIRDINVDSLSSMGAIIANINNLKELNAKYSNSFGDDVIRNVAEILKEKCGSDSVYRYGGATFAVLLPDISYDTFIEDIQSLKERFEVFPNCNVTMGHTWSEKINSVEKLIYEADELMIATRRQQGNVSPKRTNKANEIMKDLLSAISEGRCLMYLQPKAYTDTLEICSAEALVRIKDTDGNLILPGKFIPLLEEVGFIRYVDLFIFEEALKLLDRWGKEGRSVYRISLNFSRSTFVEPNLINTICNIADKYEVSRDLIEIEITESIGNLEIETIRQIGKDIISAGFRLSMDDFGSDYSNLSILSALEFSAVKLDKTLIDRIVSNKISYSIVKSIIDLCIEYGMDVVAEGVETVEQLNLLNKANCPLVQGYYINKPLPVSEYENRYNKDIE